MDIDSTKQGEKLDSVFRKFGEVLVDHLQSALEHVLHDRWHLIFHKRLKPKLVILFGNNLHLYNSDYERGDAPPSISSDVGSNVQKAW